MTLSRFVRLLVLLGMAAGLLAACSSTTVDKGGIAVTLLAAKLPPPDQPAAPVVLKLRLQNELVYPFAMEGLTCQVFIDEILLGTVFNNQLLGLPLEKPVDCEVRLTAINATALEQVRARIAAGPVPYRLESSCRTSVDDNDRLIVKDSKSGTVDLR